MGREPGTICTGRSSTDQDRDDSRSPRPILSRWSRSRREWTAGLMRHIGRLRTGTNGRPRDSSILSRTSAAMSPSISETDAALVEDAAGRHLHMRRAPRPGMARKGEERQAAPDAARSRKRRADPCSLEGDGRPGSRIRHFGDPPCPATSTVRRARARATRPSRGGRAGIDCSGGGCLERTEKLRVTQDTHGVGVDERATSSGSKWLRSWLTRRESR